MNAAASWISFTHAYLPRIKPDLLLKLLGQARHMVRRLASSMRAGDASSHPSDI
jgi:hypothetical protein